MTGGKLLIKAEWKRLRSGISQRCHVSHSSSASQTMSRAMWRVSVSASGLSLAASEQFSGFNVCPSSFGSETASELWSRLTPKSLQVKSCSLLWASSFRHFVRHTCPVQQWLLLTAVSVSCPPCLRTWAGQNIRNTREWSTLKHRTDVCQLKLLKKRH